MQHIEQLSQKQWDVIIVGSGIGGATAGYVLVKKNLQVLFLEKGIDVTGNSTQDQSIHPDERIKGGWWPYPISHQISEHNIHRFYASVGCGVGGTSLYYAAALERLHPNDFGRYQSNDINIEPWPISFQEFEPYYSAAEEIYGLDGDSIIKWESRISEWDRALISNLRQSGLKPERLNVAIKFHENCEECIGITCSKDCKQDARNACLNKVLDFENCTIVKNCEVTKLVANQTHVEYVECNINGEAVSFTAKKIILAAGALHTPQLLLRSANDFWPHGLANSSGQVGKNLMFHGLELYAIWAPQKYNRNGKQKKSLAIKDFYYHNNTPLGFVQSLGIDAGQGVISIYIKDMLSKFGITNKYIQSLLAKVPAIIAAKIFGEASIFAAQIEDFPSEGNRICLNRKEPNQSSFTYTITDDLRNRAKQLRERLSSHLNGWRLIKITPSTDFNSGHACGTCKFGNDPTTSVLDAQCKAHDLQNLYIADSSFMPRSGAANPSLTIAANAIRVAENVAAVLSKDQ